jgi:hypothetical protein
MSGVFQILTRRVCTPPRPPPLVRGEDTLAGGRGGWGVNILEDARHSSVLSYVSTLCVDLWLRALMHQNPVRCR